MVGDTLRDLRERIADRHEADGRFYVSCARTGERPVPVAGKRFPDRETATEAVQAAAAYRAELRRYDPRLPCYDLVVSEDPFLDSAAAERADRGDRLDARTDGGTRMDFCHDVAAAVFEALSALDARSVERAVMDAYLYSAESVADPDDLCLVLLSTMAAELDARLDPDRQHAVLRSAADRLGVEPTAEDPVSTTLGRFAGRSLLDDYAVAPESDSAPDGRSWAVTLDGYAFEASTGNLPTLPLAVELLGRCPDGAIAITDVSRVGDGWECVVTAGVDRSVGVATAAVADD
ncbi:DUF7551 domain-containing protein [Halorussus halobius]|uniref:DUF7551 domain-containing protein n=1 Tax=Halorussus halobius TaxID=1710537 RepID=UPI0010922935|nr:hypothetical protein [Halorussus halobius]